MPQLAFSIQRSKQTLFLLALGPLLYLIWSGYHDELGANPIETLTHATGEWALRFLMFTLFVTPIRKITGFNQLIQFRRILGLYAFFYACLHLIIWVWLDQSLLWQDMLEDIIKRPYITIGFSSLILMLPLAITSTNTMIKRLGGKRWKKLHQLIYVAALCACIHFLWLVKADIMEPLIYILTYIILMLARTNAGLKFILQLRQ